MGVSWETGSGDIFGFLECVTVMLTGDALASDMSLDEAQIYCQQHIECDGVSCGPSDCSAVTNVAIGGRADGYNTWNFYERGPSTGS